MPAGFEPKSGLSQAEATDRLAGLQLGQPALFLLLRAVGQDGIHHQRALHGDEAAQAGIAALQLLHDQAVLDVAHAGAAIAFEIGAQEAEPAQFGDDLFGKSAIAEAVADDGNRRGLRRIAGQSGGPAIPVR